MSIQDLRNKLKPTPVAATQAQDAALNQSLGIKDWADDRHSIDNGRNMFRFYPPHEPVDENGRPNPYAEPLVVTYLPAWVPERDSDKKIIKGPDGKPKLKLSVRPVFNAKIHGKKDKLGNPLTRDLVEEFIRMAHDKVKNAGEEERKKYLLPIYGHFSRDPAKNIGGINYKPQWMIWADKIVGEARTLKMLPIGKSVKNRINKIAALESANEPLGTDPFTDLDEGRAVVIVYNKDAEKAEDYYSTEIDNATVEEVLSLDGGKTRTIKTLKVYPISDDQLLAFSKVKSLYEQYRNAFKRTDLDLQIEGLKLLDEKYQMGIFQTDEFMAIIEELLNQYPEEATTTTTENENGEDPFPTTTTTASAPAPTTTTTTVEVRTDLSFDNDPDMFSEMTRADMKEFAADNKTGIIILPASSMSDDVLRDKLRTWYRSMQDESVSETTTAAPVQETTTTTTQAPVVTETTTIAPAASTTTGSVKDRLEALKAKTTATTTVAP